MGGDLQVTSDYKTVQQLVTDRIRQAILDGTFKPNDRLHQAELASKLNVSRIPTREALRILEGEGLVKITPHRGAVVSTMSAEEIEEVYEARILLEVRAAQRALKFMAPEDLVKIKALQASMVQTTTIETWVELNDAFHQAIYAPSNWTKLLGVVETLRNLTAPYVRLYISHSWDRCAANAEHAEIVRAVEARDAVQTKNALKKHLRHTCEGIIDHLKKTNETVSLGEAS